MASDEEELKRWLSGAMTARRLTMRQVARLTGVHTSTISRLLAGARDPTWRTVSQISEGLGIAPPGSVARNTPLRTVLEQDLVLSVLDRRRVEEYYLAVRQAAVVRGTSTALAARPVIIKLHQDQPEPGRRPGSYVDRTTAAEDALVEAVQQARHRARVVDPV